MSFRSFIQIFCILLHLTYLAGCNDNSPTGSSPSPTTSGTSNESATSPQSSKNPTASSNSTQSYTYTETPLIARAKASYPSCPIEIYEEIVQRCVAKGNSDHDCLGLVFRDRASLGSVGCSILSLEKGVDIDVKRTDLNLSEHYHIDSGTALSGVAYLLGISSPLQPSRDEWSTLMNVFIEADADVNDIDIGGYTPLMLLLVEPLLEPNDELSSLCMFIKPLLEKLIESGADVSVQAEDGETALTLAQKKNCTSDVIEMLTETE